MDNTNDQLGMSWGSVGFFGNYSNLASLLLNSTFWLGKLLICSQLTPATLSLLVDPLEKTATC